MGYLKTILTYHLPSEAEVDKAFLESHGISVCLLNANTSRNELGTPFFVRLQVMEEDAENACSLIKQTNPQRFGSSERANEIDREIKRSLAKFAYIAVPVGIAAGLTVYFLTGDPAHPGAVYLHGKWVLPNFRVELSILTGLAASVVSAVSYSRRRK